MYIGHLTICTVKVAEPMQRTSLLKRNSRYCNGNKYNGVICRFRIANHRAYYLVCRCDLKLVENGHVQIIGGRHNEEKGQHHQPVHGAELVYFGRRTEQRDGRHKTGGHRKQRGRLTLDSFI